MVSKYDIAANAELAEVSGKAVKLTAAQQKAIFGGHVFGKATLMINTDGQGEVVASKTVCFGTDSIYARFTFEQVADAVNSGRRLSVA